MQRRLEFLVYACHKCGKMMTHRYIQGKWEKAESTKVDMDSLCPCGSNLFRPINPKWWQELLYPSLWVVILLDVFGLDKYWERLWKR